MVGIPGRRQPGQVAEHLATRNEDLFLGGQVCAAGFHQRNHREPVLQRDLLGPQNLSKRPRVAGAALDRRVVGHDHAFHAVDRADPGDQAGADLEGAAVGRQRAQLQERRVRVDQQFDALAGGQLAAGVVALDVLGAATAKRFGEFGFDLLEPGLRDGCRCRVRLALRVECGPQRAHDWKPSSLAASEVRISVVPPPMPRIRMSRYWRSISDSAMYPMPPNS